MTTQPRSKRPFAHCSDWFNDVGMKMPVDDFAIHRIVHGICHDEKTAEPYLDCWIELEDNHPLGSLVIAFAASPDESTSPPFETYKDAQWPFYIARRATELYRYHPGEYLAARTLTDHPGPWRHNLRLHLGAEAQATGHNWEALVSRLGTYQKLNYLRSTRV